MQKDFYEYIGDYPGRILTFIFALEEEIYVYSVLISLSLFFFHME